MKLRKLLSVGLFSLLPTLAFAQVTETQISFNGNISSSTCIIKPSKSVVDLEEVSLDIKEFRDYDYDYDGSISFQENALSLTIINCDNTISPKLSIAELKNNNGRFTNQLSGNEAAKNLMMKVEIFDNEKIYYNNDIEEGITLSKKNLKGEFNIYIEYHKYAGSHVIPGKFKTTMTFVVDYK